MSSFVVQDKTINAIVGHINITLTRGEWSGRQELQALGYDVPTVEGCKALGQAMLDLNYAAVNVRYNQRDTPHQLAYRLVAVSPIQAIKALQCWLYQCTEGHIDETPLFLAMKEIKAEWADQVISTLPEYEKANWG